MKHPEAIIFSYPETRQQVVPMRDVWDFLDHQDRLWIATWVMWENYSYAPALQVWDDNFRTVCITTGDRVLLERDVPDDIRLARVARDKEAFDLRVQQRVEEERAAALAYARTMGYSNSAMRADMHAQPITQAGNERFKWISYAIEVTRNAGKLES